VIKSLVLLFCICLSAGCQSPSQAVKPIETGSIETRSVPVSIGQRIYGPNGDTHWNLPGKEPHLIAHYLPWFETDLNDPQDPWKHWKWQHPKADHDPTRTLANGLRDIASVNYPLIGPYSSDAPNVIAYHLKTMQAAGIDAVAFLWYGPNNPIDKRVKLVLDEAEKLGMRVAICYEEKINWPPYRFPQQRSQIVQQTINDLNYLLEHYTQHPAYLRRDNVPFIFQFNYSGADELGPRNILPGEFETILSALDKPLIYGRQNLHEAYHPNVPSTFVWFDMGNWPSTFGQRAEALRQQGKLLFYMTMICPGFNDSGVWGWSSEPRISEAYGQMTTLKKTCKIATEQHPELVQIVTWNDFNEGTVVEPTVENGYKILDEIELWWNNMTGRSVNLLDNRDAYRQYLKTCSPAQRSLLPLVENKRLEP
jgi:hypothetical protein